MRWIKNLYYWTLEFADKKYNALALSVISFAEASFFLIPPEVLFLPMATAKPKKAFFYAFLMTTCSVLGAIFGYWIGMTFWDALSPYFFEYVFKQEQFAYVKDLFNNHSFQTVFVAGFTPIPFKVFTVAAGVVATPLGVFVLASVLSRGMRYFFLAALFYFFGPSIRTWIDRNFEKATIVIGLLVIALIVAIQFLRP